MRGQQELNLRCGHGRQRLEFLSIRQETLCVKHSIVGNRPKEKHNISPEEAFHSSNITTNNVSLIGLAKKTTTQEPAGSATTLRMPNFRDSQSENLPITETTHVVLREMGSSLILLSQPRLCNVHFRNRPTGCINEGVTSQLPLPQSRTCIPPE